MSSDHGLPGGCAASNSDQVRLLFSVQLVPLSQTRAFIKSAKAFFNKSPAGALDCEHAGVEHSSDLLIYKTLVSFDQDACPHYFAR